MYTTNDIPQFRIRCSAIGKIMTEPRGKSISEKVADAEKTLAEKTVKLSEAKPGTKTHANIQAAIKKLEAEIEALKKRIDEPNLSETCISYLESWVTEKLYARRVDFTAKTTDKGNLVEDDAIAYLSCHVPGFEFATKNTEHFADEYMHGSPDVLEAEIGADVKSSWNHSTFPLYYNELPSADYYGQMQGYMNLTGRKKWKVIYCLMSIPEEMLLKEARHRLGPDYSKEQFDEFAANYMYDDLPPHLRIKEFDVSYDPEYIERVKTRVTECRKYIADNLIPIIQKQESKYND